MAISLDRPAYLDEGAAFHALRTLNDWLLSSGRGPHYLYSMTIEAGSYQVVSALEAWLGHGVLSLQSASATPTC